MRKVSYGIFASEPYNDYDPYWPIGMKNAARKANAERTVTKRYYITDEYGTNIIVEDPTIIEKLIARIKYEFYMTEHDRIVGYDTNGTTSKAKRQRFLQDNKAKVSERKAKEAVRHSKTTDKEKTSR